MGAFYSTKRDEFVMSPEDTKLLLGDARHRQICKAYERISGEKGLDCNGFEMLVLGGFRRMPKFLSDRIFFALDMAGKGIITAANFAASMAVMLCSSPEAIEGRYVLLFHIYDIFRGGTLERASLKRVLSIAYPDIARSELTGAIDDFFGKSSVLEYEEFRWRLSACTISKRHVGKLLTGWFYTICNHLMDEPDPELVALEQRYNSERDLWKFVSEHNIDDQTIAELQMRHAALCKQGVSGRLDPGVFCQVVDSVIHEDLALRIFSYYCSASRLRWTIYDFVKFAIEGSFEEQQQLLFDLFDNDEDGILNQVEVELMLESLAWHHIHRDGNFPNQQHTPLSVLRTPTSYPSCSSTGRRRSVSITRLYKGDHLLDYGLVKIGYHAPEYDLAELARNILKSAKEKSKQPIIDHEGGSSSSSSEFFRNNGLTLRGFVLWLQEHSGRVQLLLDLCLISAAEFHMRPINEQQEKRIIQDICHRYAPPFGSEKPHYINGPPGTWWALISTKWWTRWGLYVGYDEHKSDNKHSSSGSSLEITRPGIIENHVLLQGNLRLIGSLRRWVDFELLSPSAWECLRRWYGGGPSIQREVVRVPPTVDDEPPPPRERGRHKRSSSYRDYDVELYPLLLKVTFCNEKGHPVHGGCMFLFSKFATGQNLLEHLSAIHKLEPERMRLWNYVDRMDWHSQSLLDPQRTLLEHGLRDNQLILIEVSQSDGSWPRSKLQSILEVAEEEARTSGHYSRFDNAAGSSDTADGGSISNMKQMTAYESNELGGATDHAPPATRIFGDGLTGMNNLGNTCYVNSSMQCLSHTPLLKDYFLNLKYLRDVNVKNKMGKGGRLAQESDVYAELVQELWSPSKKTVTPKQFKTAIARFNGQFSGNDQHDAHDLLTFVLNGLNEDLNRIAEKPYIEQPDSDGRSDKELADIWWRNHLCRELSIVVALFGGQFKSLLTCQSCEYESARFEPFLCLQLPLPEVSCRPITAVLVPLTGSLCPLQCVVEVPRTGTIWDTAVALVEVLKSIEKGNLTNSSRDSLGSCFDSGEDMDTAVENMDSKISGEEETSLYDCLTIGPADLIAVDITTPEQIFSVIPMYRKVCTIKNGKVIYFYELERNVSTPLSGDGISDTGVEVAKSMATTIPPSQEKSHPSELSEGMNVNIGPTKGRKPSLDYTDSQESTLSRGDSGAGVLSTLGPLHDLSVAETEYATGVSLTANFHTTTKAEAQQLNEKQHEAMPHLKQGYPHSSSNTPIATPAGSSASYSVPSYRPTNQSLFYVVHRSLERTKVYFSNYFRLRLLPMPLVCSLDFRKSVTGVELYDWLASRFERFIKDPIHISSIHKGSKGRRGLASYGPHSSRSSLTLERFKNMDWSETCMPRGSSKNLNEDADDKSTRCGPTRDTSSAIAAGPLNKWGFRLTCVTRDGTACGKCNWLKGCVGCLIPPNSEEVGLKQNDTIAVDWHISIMKERYDEVEASRKVTHSSVRDSQRLDKYSLSLERCMDEFTAEEIIPEGYCSNCKKLLPAKIKMDIWRLPPILVIQLKRFQYTNYSRMKLRNLVNFPINGLDLSPWIVKDQGKNSSTDKCSTSSFTAGHVFEDGEECDNKNAVGGVQCEDDDDGEAAESATTNGEHGGGGGGNPEAYPGKDGRYESLYDLYAVVHHLGALSAGHYVASVKDKDGQWHYFNDNQVCAIDEKNLVSTSAYILFYIRRDMRGISIDDVYPARVASGHLDLADIEAMMRQRDSAHCQVS